MERTPSDHALALFKAGLAVIPGVGGALSTLVSEYIPTSTQRRVGQAIELLKERLAEIQDRIDPNAIDREDFAELFKSAYWTIMRTHRDEKLKAAVSIVGNCLLGHGDPEKLDFEELDHFARAIDQLSIGAIHVLVRVYGLTGGRRTQDSFLGSRRITFEQIAGALPEAEPSFLMGLVGELNAANLLHVAGSPAVRTPDYGNYPIELPPVGIRFVERILRHGTDASAT